MMTCDPSPCAYLVIHSNFAHTFNAPSPFRVSFGESVTITCESAKLRYIGLLKIFMTGIAHTELKEVNKCHFLTTKGP